MARATAPSRRPASAMAAAAASAAAPPSAAARAASLVPQRRATATVPASGALSRSRHQPHHHHRHRLAPPVVVVAPGAPPKQRASCACSPTTHPGSYRCALHRGQSQGGSGGGAPLPLTASTAPVPVSSRLSAPRRASMANPLVRIAAVEGGDHIRRALAALVRPPPSQTRRRADAFRPTPSRLSAMSSASCELTP